MKRALITISFVIAAVSVFSQSTNIGTLFKNDLKKGDEFYKHLAYQNALDFYLRYASNHPVNVVVQERIAACYSRLGNFAEAERWYKILATDSSAKPVHFFNYGQVLSVNQKYDLALQAFNTFFQKAQDDERIKGKIEFLRQIEYHLRDSNLFTVTNEWYNSDQSDFAAQFYRDGVVFVSARDRDLFLKKKSLSALNEDEALLNAFFVLPEFDENKGVEEQVEMFYKKDLSSPYHDGPVTFYEDGNRIAFTRNIMRDGKAVRDSENRVNLELYFARLRENKTLSNLEAFPYNDTEFSVAHPWISNDGTTLYFASDMPGGFGGADIYRSLNKDGKWSKPENLGSPINTKGDEFCPFVYKDSVLFFSSNGHGGFGGLDNFSSRFNGSKFSEPMNMSYPINTSQDDFSLIVDNTGRNGLFASNRKGGHGYDDVYRFTLNKFTLLGTVVERSSKDAVRDATIVILDEQNIPFQTLRTNSEGHFYAKLPLDQKFRVVAQKQGYTSIDTAQVTTSHVSVLTDTLSILIWEHGLFAKGMIYSNESQSVLHNATVKIKNLTTGEIDSVDVGDSGAYNFLVLPNVQYAITAGKAGFISQGFNLNTIGLYKGHLVNDILLEETYLEKFELQFDFDKWDIKGTFLNSLNKIVRDLKRAPQATIHIGAHADATGTREYNLGLSNKRADAVVQYLVQNGIQRSRIQAIGFGEELILNRCSDGVDCSEEEHSLNRRAEIKIQLPAKEE
jgi:outer membrane protein OmpA-like peptidoglycan-associated protein/tetratricopeptide (TPR) repeat protein